MKDQSRASGFFAQGGLILLPVLVLAVIGFNALRQDRRMIDAEAKERAEQLAKQWLEAISLEWSSAEDAATNQHSLAHALPLGQGAVGFFFSMDADGRLVFPPPYDAVPTPQPLDPAELSSPQTALWTTALRLESEVAGARAIADAYQEFLESAPPPRFAASAQFVRALWLMQEGKNSDAEKVWRSIDDDFPTEAAETGIPLQHLAHLRLLELDRASPSALEGIRSNAVYRPSLLSPQLLDLAGRARERTPHPLEIETNYEAIWARHESTRRIYRALKSQFSPRLKPEVWLPAACVLQLDKPCAIVRLNAGNAEPIKMLAFPAGEAPLPDFRHADLAARRGDIFGVTVSMSGVVVHQEGIQENPKPHADHTGQGSTDPSQWPALATAVKNTEGAEMVKIQVHLANSALFYARHGQRTTWLAVLIGSAAVAAVLGWIAMRRAFARQRQLAEMKTNFVSSVSHELRAPIASVRLMAEGLESGRIKDEAKKREYFGFIVQECRRLSSLIENVLDFSRIEQGRKQYEFELTDVSALIHQTSNLMEPYAAERQIQLEIAASQPPTLNSQPVLDGRAIQQALVNLIDNAIKHSAKGSTVTIGLEFPTEPKPCEDGCPNPPRRAASGSASSPREARAGRGLRRGEAHQDEPPLPGPLLHPMEKREESRGFRPPSSPCLRLWVEDHGEGIPPEEHERIFERFYRLGPELRRETQGVGIGLSLVKHIVEAHGGRVLVRSSVGQGSRFTIELPAHPGEEGKNPCAH